MCRHFLGKILGIELMFSFQCKLLVSLFTTHNSVIIRNMYTYSLQIIRSSIGLNQALTHPQLFIPDSPLLLFDYYLYSNKQYIY